MSVSVSIGLGGGYPIREYIPMAQLAESYGVDDIHVGDDIILRPAWPILTLIAEHTEHVRLGTGVTTSTLAHPAYHAAHLALLDELSGGRAVCGISRGGFNALLGIGLEKPLTLVRETVEVINRMLARDTAPYEGEYFNCSPALVFDHEPSRARVPLFIGTWGPKMSRLAGRIAAGIKVDCVADPSYFATLVENVCAGAREAGRNPDELEIMASPLCTISTDREAARSATKRKLAMYYPFLHPLTEIAGVTQAEIDAANGAYLAGDLDLAETLVSEAVVDALSISGTPDDVMPMVDALVEAGANHIGFGFTGDLGPGFEESMTLIGEQLVPRVRALEPTPHTARRTGDDT
jgi:5,10-methylenetetrahydromethanopterin reductase